MRWRNLSCILKTDNYDINLGSLKKNKVTLSQQLDDICIITGAQIVVS